MFNDVGHWGVFYHVWGELYCYSTLVASLDLGHWGWVVAHCIRVRVGGVLSMGGLFIFGVFVGFGHEYLVDLGVYGL